MDRRSFFRRAVSGFSWSCLALAIGYPLFAFVTFSKRRKIDLVFSREERIGRVTLKNGVFLLRQENDFKALSARCTHLGCTVRHDPLLDRFVCPCHGSLFDAEGRLIQGPAGKDLESLPVKIDQEGGITVSFML